MDSPETAYVPVLDRFRDYLVVLARLHLGEQLRGKVDASDVVHEALLEAHRKRDQFRGHCDAELAAWLRQMLACTLADALRAHSRARRDVARERSLEAALAASSARLEAFLAAAEPSPSRQAEHNEQLLRLAEALTRLPPAQRQVVELRHLQGWSLEAIGRHLDRTPAAVAGLLHRGLRQLRTVLHQGNES
jgi:RNA polymerase sigma-70 factor (ECF subfamily)